MRHDWSTFALCIVCCALDSASVAQDGSPPEPAPVASTQPAAVPPQAPSSPPSGATAEPRSSAVSTAKIQFNFKGASFQQVVEFFSRATGLPVIWETSPPEGTLDYVSPRDYDMPAALQELNRILQSKGVMLRVNRDNLYLQKLDQMQKEDVPTFIGQVPEKITADQIVTVVRPLNIALAKPLAEKLGALVAPYGAVTALEQQNHLIITETAAQVRRLLTIVEQLDQTDPEGAVEIFKIQHAKATELMTPLKALLSQKVEKFVINQQGQQVKLEEDQMPGLAISSDERTNSIIAKGVQNKIEKLREAIELLDVPASKSNAGRSMTTIAVSRLTPAEAAEKLNQLYARIPEKDRPTVLAFEDAQKIMIVGSDGAVSEGNLLIAEIDGGPVAPTGDAQTISVIPLERAGAQQLVVAINSLLTKRQQANLKLVPGVDGKSLIVAGTTGDVESVKAIIPMLDRQAEVAQQVRVVKLNSGDPNAIVRQATIAFTIANPDAKVVQLLQGNGALTSPQEANLNQIFIDLAAESRTATLIGPAKLVDTFTSVLRQFESTVIVDREAKRIELANVLPSEMITPLTLMANQLLQPTDGTTFVAPVFAAIDQLSAIIVTATPQQFATIESLITSLDQAKSAETPPLRILQLRIADAANLANVIMAQYNQRPPHERKAKPVNVAADPQTNTLLVAAHADVFAEIQVIVEGLNTTERTDSEARELQIFPLKVARATELARTIDEMFPQPPPPVDLRGRPQTHLQKPKPVIVRADPQTNSLILSALPGVLNLTQEVIQQLDVDPTQIGNSGAVRVLTLNNADANQLAANIEALFVNVGVAGGVNKPTVRVDASSNSLLIRATDDQFKMIEEVASKIDQAAIATSRQMRIISVDANKASADEVARTLQRLLDRNTGSSKVQVISLEELLKRQQTENTPPDPKSGAFVSPSLQLAILACLVAIHQEQASEPKEPEVTIAVDPATNSLIIVGSSRAVERINALAKQIQDQIPAAPGTIRYITLPQNVDAQNLTTLITQTLERITPPGGQVGDVRRRTAIIADGPGNALIISANDTDFETVAELIAALSKPISHEFPIRTITLARAEAGPVATAIQKFFDDRAKLLRRTRGPENRSAISIMGVETSNTLLVCASDDDFKQVQELVEKFDTAEASAGLTFRVFQLKHAKAVEIERSVQSLVNDLVWNQGDSFVYFWPPRPQQNTKKDSIAIRADARLNALIVTGKGDKFAVVEQMIDILDAPAPDGERKVVRLYQLKNAQLQTVADVVRDAFNQSRQRRFWEPPDPNEIRVRTDENSNTVIISASAKEHEEIKSLIDGIDSQVALPDQITQVIPVKFGRAVDLAGTLSRFVADRARAINAPKPSSTITASDSANTVIVSASQEELATISDLLSRLDQPDVTGDRVVEILVLQEGRADDIARIIREQFGRRAIAGTGGVIVTADVRTNSIIVNAPQAEFAQAKALIERLDAPSDADETIIRTYALNDAIADQAVRTLTQTLQLDARGATPGKGITIKLDDANAVPVEVKARIVADKRSNSLIVTATQQSFPVIEALISKLDEVPAKNPQEWRIISLKHAMATNVSTTLSAMTRGLDDGQPAPRIDYNRLENKLVIAATADQFKQIEKVLEQIDQPSELERITDFVALEHAQAEKIQEALSVFYGPMAAEADTPAKRNVRIVADPATNSLVISAEKDEWEGIRALLGRLDSAEYDSSLQLKVLPLLYADSQSVARAINEAFTAQVQRPTRGSGGGANRQQPPFPTGFDFFNQGPSTTLVQADEWVRASAEPQTNAVIVSASRQNLAKVEEIVKQLDKADYAKLPPPQIISLSGGGDPIQFAQSLMQLYVQSRPGAVGSGGAGYPPLSIVGNAAANAIIVRAEQDDFEQIKTLADALQQQASSNGLTVRVLKLNAASAARVATALTDAFQAKARQTNQPLSIRVEPAGNSLVIASTGPLFEEIKATAAQLDAMAPASGHGIFIIDLQNIAPENAKSVIETIGLDKPQPPDSVSRIVSEPIKVSLLPGRSSVVVVASPADRETVIGLLKALDATPLLAESQTRIVKLKQAQAQALSQILNQVLSPGDQQSETPLARAVREQVRRLSIAPLAPGSAGGTTDGDAATLDLTKPIRIIPDPNLNALVISSTKDNVAALERIITMFDALPITDAVTVQLFPLQNISAEQFSRIVKEMFAQGKQLGKSALTKISGVPDGAVGKALLDDIAISIDERTNTVIVAGSEQAVALVEVLTQRIDAAVTAGWVEPKVLPLRYADAADLATTLQSIIVEGATNLPQSSPLQRQIGRLRMARVPQNGGNVIESDVFVPMTRLVIKPEPQMNALILVGTPDNIEVVSELVTMLDIESASPSNAVRIYPVENASASRLAQTIRTLFDQQVQSKAIRPEDRVMVQPDERTNSLVVATSPRSFAVLEGLFKTLDSKLAPDLREIRMIEVKNASATRLANLIQQMMDARLERLRKVQPETADLERATIVADPRTNNLVVAAGNDSFEVIKRLAADLDNSLLGDSSLISVVPMAKGNVERVASAINQIMQRRYADMPAELRNSIRPLVLTDLRTNSLLVAANPEDLKAIEDLVAKLAESPENPAVSINLVTLPPSTRAELIAPRLQRLMAERQASLGSSGTPTDKVTIEPDLASNSLIVAATEENLEIIRSFIDVLLHADALGGPAAGREMEIVSLVANRASEIVDMLDDLYIQEANRTRGAGTVKVTSDERLNAVVINAPPGDVRALKNLISQLDGAKPASVVEIKYVPLQSANAVETVSLIENVLSGRGIGARRGSRQATVLKYLREIVKTSGVDDDKSAKPIANPPTIVESGAVDQPDVEDEPVEMEVSAAIRETITLTPDLRTNTIIVSAPSNSIQMIEQMIRDLDASNTGSKSIRIFKLVNADAIAMSEILTDLFNLRQGSNLYVLKPREDESLSPLAASRPPSPPNELSGVPGEVATMGAAPSSSGAIAGGGGGGVGGTELTAVPDERQQLSITVDSRTNSLIVSGTPNYLDLVSQVVEELDKLEANEREVYVYQLRNAIALDVAKVIGEFVEQEQRKLVGTLSADQIGSAARLLEREITIQGDQQSNTVLVSASPRYMERVKEMIRKLDVDPPQVLIQVMLAEVTLDTRDEWGVDLLGSFEVGSATVTGGFGLASAFVNGLGVPNLAITSSDFDLLIRAMKSQGRLQVLSNPSIMAANNQEARIQVGETIRLPEATSFELGSQQTSVVPEDIGVILKVTPSINPDGFVRMEINPEISSLSARTTQISEDFQSPIITRRRAETTVTVHDGQTIVLGGLISDRFERRDRMVPFFGELPLIGPLFRSNIEETAKTELLIVLTPHVIDSPTEFERVDQITDREINRLTVPDEVKESIRRSLIDGTGGLYDAKGNKIDVKIQEKEKEEENK